MRTLMISLVIAGCGRSPHVEDAGSHRAAIWIQRTHQESQISADRRVHVITRTLTLTGGVATLEVRTVARDRAAVGGAWEPEAAATTTGTVAPVAGGLAIDVEDVHWVCAPRRQAVADAAAVRAGAGAGEDATGDWRPAATTSLDTLACGDLLDFGAAPGIEDACATNLGCGLRRVPADGAIVPVAR